MIRYTYLATVLIFLFSVQVNSQNKELFDTKELKKGLEKYYRINDSLIEVNRFDKKERLTEKRIFIQDTILIEHGEWFTYHPKGMITAVRYFDQGVPIGVWRKFKKNGKIRDSVNYGFSMQFYNDKRNQLQDLDSIIENPIDKVPTFNGGDINAFRTYVQRNLLLDRYTFEKYQGTGKHVINVKFMITEKGEVTNIEVNKHGKKILQKEAGRVVLSSPVWNPGKKKGKNVPVQFTFPVIFIFP